MLVPVIFTDDSIELVSSHELDELINSGDIISFRRTSGWVRIGIDPIRKGKNDYQGPEQRH